jgi:hypothetical protein
MAQALALNWYNSIDDDEILDDFEKLSTALISQFPRRKRVPDDGTAYRDMVDLKQVNLTIHEYVEMVRSIHRRLPAGVKQPPRGFRISFDGPTALARSVADL